MDELTREHHDDGSPRRAYEQPAIVDTAEFETLALACAKQDSGDPDCFDGGPKAS